MSASEMPKASVEGVVSAEPRWPLLGVLVAAVLFVLAALRYPGGYAWAGQSISSLFQPLALDGTANSARPIAVASVLFFCVGVAAVFERISRRGRSRAQRNVIQIAGVGSMVYAFLTVTPMHDVLVGVALGFFVVAMLALFHLLWVERSRWMLAAGLACLSGTLWNAVIHYGSLGSGFLPVVQKFSTLLWVAWLFVLYFRGRTVPTAARA